MKYKNRTKIEQFVIDVVREKRTKNNISQSKLASLLNVSAGFVGKIESFKYSNKYNLNHINKLAEIFKCSPKVFLPEKTI